MKNISRFPVILALILGSGLLTGWFYGTHIINRLMTGEIGFSTFIFTPSKNLLDTYIMLNSVNTLKRLEGYYSYREAGLRDIDFLYTRYKLEESDIIKKTIIWIAESSTTNEKIDFYKKLQDISSGSLKKYLQVKIDRFELLENNMNQPSGEKK